MKRLILCLPLLASCAALGDETVVDPETGQTAGEVRQNEVATSVGAIVGTATANPGLGIGAMALASLFLASRFKKKDGTTA